MAKFTSKLGSYLADFLEILIVSVFVFALVYLFVGQLLEVSGQSMTPTLLDKEQIIAEKLSIRLKPVERGDIVILRYPKNPSRLLVKRVVGLPGETIEIKSGKVYINGSLLEEPYLEIGTRTMGREFLADDKPVKIPQEAYMVMGDNRVHSEDSRNWGPVPIGDIVGRGLLVYYPIQNFRLIER